MTKSKQRRAEHGLNISGEVQREMTRQRFKGRRDAGIVESLPLHLAVSGETEVRYSSVHSLTDCSVQLEQCISALTHVKERGCYFKRQEWKKSSLNNLLSCSL